MYPIKLVLFVLDDTLLHFDDYWENSVKDAFRNHFFTSEMNSNDLFEVFSNVEQFLVKKLDSKQISFDEYRTKRFLYSMDQMGKTTNVETAINFEMFYQSISKKHMKPNVMINKTIKDLSNYYQIGVLTNGSKGWQNDKLEAIGLDGIIPKEYVFISEVIGYEKPSPEIYHYVLSMTSLSPEQVLVVGDSWTNDVAAPIQEGLKAIWLNATTPCPSTPAHPPFRVLPCFTWPLVGVPFDLTQFSVRKTKSMASVNRGQKKEESRCYPNSTQS